MNDLSTYFPNLTATQINQFQRLAAIYKTWNDKINVISRKDIDNFNTNHLLHSLAIAKVKKFKAKDKILDVGTGGGFPGVPLAIMFPETAFTLIDSIGKKITVVNEVIKELGLKNITAKQIRAEDLQEKYDFVVSRAVTQMPKFVAWIKGKLIEKEGNGIYYLKGGDLTVELDDFKKAEIFEISDFFAEEFFAEKKVVYISHKDLF